MKCDFLLVADAAEATGGKLYMLGGGWDRIALSQFPGGARFDVALGIVVAYHETNERHTFEVALEDEDNRVVLGPFGGNFEMGRPPGLKPGQAQRFMVAVKGPFTIPAPGGYQWVATLDGERAGQTSIWVDALQQPASR